MCFNGSSSCLFSTSLWECLAPIMLSMKTGVFFHVIGLHLIYITWNVVLQTSTSHLRQNSKGSGITICWSFHTEPSFSPVNILTGSFFFIWLSMHAAGEKCPMLNSSVHTHTSLSCLRHPKGHDRIAEVSRLSLILQSPPVSFGLPPL